MLDFLQKPKKEQEFFWAILIESEWVSSAVWQIEDGKVKIISSSPSTRWEEDLVTAIDTSLSACMQDLPEETPDPTKTVFGVPSSWITEGNIKEEHLTTLKKVCDDLSLVPSGFVVLSEAISHFVKYEEESSLTGIIAGISDQNLELSIFNLGVLVGVTNVSRSVSIEDDLTEGLTRLGSNIDNFPARIILFNQKEQELEEISETLNNSDWSKIGASKFIHTPRVEIFDPSKKILAVSLAGGSELGAVNGITTLNQTAEKVEETIETKTEELPLEEVNNFEEPDEVTARDLGFVEEQNEDGQKVETPVMPILPKLPNITSVMANLSHIKRPNIKLPKFNLGHGGKPLVIGSSALLTFIVATIILWWFLPKATVTVFVAPKKIEENISITESDVKTNEVSVSVNGEKSKSTTGTKVVGEKAKGSVKIQNGTAFPINLPSGSTLTSSGDLRFVTTSSASVSGALSPSNPGTATIEIEAFTIGSEYNVNKDEVFKVSNYPKAEVDATSVDSFTGGSSRQISSVAERDRESLLEDLTEELLKDAEDKLRSQIADGDYLIETSLEAETDTEDFSNKAGDEATTVKLNLSLNIKASSVSKNDLSNISKGVLNNKIPSGFVLRDDQLNYEFSSNDDGFDVKVVANLLPSLDPNEVAKKVAGKYPNLAEDYLSSVPGFVRAEFKVKPLLPGKLGTLPHVSKNITVEFSADK